MSVKIRTPVLEKSMYIKYYKVNINALSHKETSSGKVIVY
jgi:hypothetical protein